jgi:hypothetical protein
LGTVLSTVALLLGFYQAPFSHIHPDDFDHPDSSSIIHWHVHHEPASAPTPLMTAPTADDDAIDVGWNALGCSSTHIPFSFEIVEAVNPPTITLSSIPASVPHRRGHDPPVLAGQSPRAPPV